KGKFVLKTRTLGLNPAVLPANVLIERLYENVDLKKYTNQISKVFFYGAGCGTIKPTLALTKVFQDYFVNAEVDVKEDTYAATYAVTSEPGIICIMGTGSNSSYFDGEEVHTTVASLGYSLMDEASGNYFGKKLINDYFYHKMPEELRIKFSEMFDLDPDSIKENIYKKENPNVYLAKFAEFIFRNERNDYFISVIKKGVDEFFENRICSYEKYQEVPVHFVGSIAYFSSDVIKMVAKKYNVTVGNIVRRPIDGLIDYHKRKLQEV
ncbi:MAG: N-acetylglucosamine kinase, partial [Flavobacteriaceae bacterium]|nr:N-acetylglucosamine kinase [Flavobacteriaceae bacterium]